VATVLLTAALGCRSGRDNQFDILESELRTQEDYIYELEDYLAEYSEKLRQCRRNQCQPSSKQRSTLTKPELVDDRAIRRSKQSQSGRPPIVDNSPRRSAPSNGAEPGRSKSIPDPSEIPELEPEDLEDLTVPELEIEEPSQSLGANISSRKGNPVLLIPDPVDYDSTASEATPFVRMPTAPEGYDSLAGSDSGDEPLLESPLANLGQDSQGDDLVDGPTEGSAVPDRLVITEVFRDSAVTLNPNSLLAVVEARNQNDEPIKFAGKASVLVLAEGDDPVRELARWDFTAEETADAWQASYLGDGLHLELPLEGKSLPEEPLEVWIRLETRAGQEMLSRLPFQRADLLALDSTSDGKASESAEQRLASNDGHLPTDAQQSQSPRWRSSTRFAGTDQGEYSSTARKTPGKWTSQPSSGRFAAAPRTAGQQPPIDSPAPPVTAGAKRPAWTATRLDRDGKPIQGSLEIPDPSASGSRPRWVPYR